LHSFAIAEYEPSINDLTVPYVTSGISAEDPFFEYKKNGIKMQVHTLVLHMLILTISQ
jgi:hypothetical protein